MFIKEIKSTLKKKHKKSIKNIKNTNEFIGILNLQTKNTKSTSEFIGIFDTDNAQLSDCLLYTSDAADE